MLLKSALGFAANTLRASCLAGIIGQMTFGGVVLQAQDTKSVVPQTASPIQHVIIIVGENRTFDHLFATYVPRPGNTVKNLLSEGIITANGTPGPNYFHAGQNEAIDNQVYSISPGHKSLFPMLPAPLVGGPENVCTNNGICTLADAESSEDGLPAEYYADMLTGGTGLTSHTPDTRITGVSPTAPYSSLQPGPFQITNTNTTDTLPYDSYAASPVHRFYQMFQQLDCSASYATADNPSGCLADLFPWVEVSVGAGANGVSRPSNFSINYSPTAATTGEGSTSMGFYNMLAGDAPYTKYLADHYAFSDNYHQPVKGGTGANSIMLGFADAIWFSDRNGSPAVPPENVNTFAGGPVQEIENPNPQSGTNNWYTEDGYGGFGNSGSSTGVYGGGSYSNCFDVTQPGVGSIRSYLADLKIRSNCDPGHYYLLNNYNPGYFGDGSNAYTNTNSSNTPFTIPPSPMKTIGDVMSAGNVTWKYYGDQFTQYLTDPYQLNYGAVGPNGDQYCNICNPFQYATSIMTTPLRNNLVDTTQLYSDIQNGTLPAVSYVKPSGWVDGHPASSKWDLYEGFVKKIVDEVQQNPSLWATTAIFVTSDEGGGYYDSGYVQTLDYFGDGTRIPLLAISPYTLAGHISHDYTDHASLIKFIERNWNLPTISNRSRDNYPDPTYRSSGSPYVPVNGPAIGDLFDLFDFSQQVKN